MSPPPETRPQKPACPICRKPATPQFRPFCSSRCANVDLQRWLSGNYVLPGDEVEDPGAGAEDES
ncbi:DNA gyrase inhibitor YacG [Phenylobacterium sp.]|uniref:DNA gyrase inhibitor YacG n=1 Tax=Phenylobacterium sp. TaxID=1871053 RepID=UPI0025EA2D05|nr:DNA gyrase inhibitor YacG [Phenylobacterium sp.]MCA3719538.1 DNA gyrase inhibitor YacG [Phenylobacterium sp.]